MFCDIEAEVSDPALLHNADPTNAQNTICGKSVWEVSDMTTGFEICVEPSMLAQIVYVIHAYCKAVFLFDVTVMAKQ